MKSNSARLSRIEPRAKLSDEITDAIRQAILTGVYAHDERLNVEDLARQLGVSAMPVREALITLGAEGLTRTVAHRGFFATPLDQQDFDDLFDLHAHISGMLAARAAEGITNTDVERLGEIQGQIVELANQVDPTRAAVELEALNQEFHRRVNTIGRGRRLRAFVRETSRYVPATLYAQATSEWLQATLRDHPPIIDALTKHDAERARALVENHIRQGASILARAPLPRRFLDTVEASGALRQATTDR